MRCSRADCIAPATATPALMLYAAINSPPCILQLTIPTCERCAALVKQSDLITDDGWSLLCSALRDIGYAEPDRALTEIQWEIIP